jgi:hypothetical protein
MPMGEWSLAAEAAVAGSLQPSNERVERLLKRHVSSVSEGIGSATNLS